VSFHFFSHAGKGRVIKKLGCILLPKASVGDDGVEVETDTADFFLAARNSASAK